LKIKGEPAFMRLCLLWLLLPAVLPMLGAERNFDFGQYQPGQMPSGFRSTVTGRGKPGQWKIVSEEVPSQMPPLSGHSPVRTVHSVLAQVSTDATDEHFPLFVYENEKFGDFTLRTKFKTVQGTVEQMAGIAFRILNESNYYVVRASSLGNTFRFYKVLDGQRGPLVGPEIPIPSGVWHDLLVECRYNQIRCELDGKQLISVTDKANAITSGKIGFWTKSDSVSYFGNTSITFQPFESSAQKIVREVMRKYPKLLGVKIYLSETNPAVTRVIASVDEKDLGQSGAKTEREVIGTGQTYYGKENDVISVIMPLRDRNGDTMAAVRVVMKSFPGQTEENAIGRASPIVKEIQARAKALDDLLD
jgi:hypothetical protein